MEEEIANTTTSTKYTCDTLARGRTGLARKRAAPFPKKVEAAFTQVANLGL